MASENDKKGTAVIRTFESQIVWLASLIAVVETSKVHIDDAPKRADDLLDAYQERFPAITPTDLPE